MYDHKYVIPCLEMRDTTEWICLFHIKNKHMIIVIAYTIGHRTVNIGKPPTGPQTFYFISSTTQPPPAQRDRSGNLECSYVILGRTNHLRRTYHIISTYFTMNYRTLDKSQPIHVQLHRSRRHPLHGPGMHARAAFGPVRCVWLEQYAYGPKPPLPPLSLK